MSGASPSRSIACPNKVGGVYSRPALGRVWWGGVGAAWGIFPAAALIGDAIGVALIRLAGAKVGCVKSAGRARNGENASFFGSGRLMGRWTGRISASGRGATGAPLGVARLSGHPVAQSGPEIWKISGQSPAISLFLPTSRAPNEKPAANGSGCARSSRHFSFKRVGGRLIFAVKARVSSIWRLSGPGMEWATLCGAAAVSTEPSSLEKSFRAITGESIVGGMEPEQLDMLRDSSGRLPADVFRQIRQRGRGRPSGARNKRNDDLARLIAQQHGDPVLFMASLYSTPLDQLVELMMVADPGSKSAKIGDVVSKAMAIQLAAAKSVAEYTHSKKPVQAEIKVGVDGVIVMPGAHALGQHPVTQVLQNTVDAINAGKVDPSQLKDLRIVDGVWENLDDGGDDARDEDYGDYGDDGA